MSDRDKSQAQHDSLRAARQDGKGTSRRAHEDALARYLRLQAAEAQPRTAEEDESEAD